MNTEEYFFDITDLFDLLKENTTYSYARDIFLVVFGTLAEQRGTYISTDKDNVSDTLRKKKLLIPEIREYILSEDSLSALNRIMSTEILRKTANRDLLVERLLYVVHSDTVIFTTNDFNLLAAHRDDPAYILTNVFAKIVATSDKTQKLKHPEGFDPFENFSSELFDKKPLSTNIGNTLTELSRSMYDSVINGENYVPKLKNELLSNGHEYEMFKDFTLNKNYVMTIENNDTFPLIDEFKGNDSLLIVGEGGVGKTTLLISYMKLFFESKCTSLKSLPLYVKLSKCSSGLDPEHCILNEIKRQLEVFIKGDSQYSLKDLLDELSRKTNDSPQYTLLLDGFNEITTNDNGTLRSNISKEINKLLEMKNLRIILVSRTTDFSDLNLEAFRSLHATGINKDEIRKYLSELNDGYKVDLIMADNDLVEHLKIPLFLIMFSYSTNESIPKTRGAILYNFYNSRESFYNEKNRQSVKMENRKMLMINALLDFILPDLGFYMEQHQKFHLEENQVEDIIQESLTRAQKYAQMRTDLFSTYNRRPNNLKQTLADLSDNIHDLTILISDYLGILCYDAENNYYFVHQYIRDYFSSYHCLREIYYISYFREIHDNTSNTLILNFGEDPWNPEIISLCAEIIDYSKDFAGKDFLQDAISCFSFERENHFEDTNLLSNILNVAIEWGNNDLSSFNLSNLDLTQCHLSNVNFYNIRSNQTSDFINTYIGQDTFALDEHLMSVDTWSISDDEKYIISFAFCEFKIWSIATQKCLQTREISVPSQSHISALRLCKNGRLALLSFANSAEQIIRILTFDLANYGEFFYDMEPDDSEIYYFDYDNFTDKLIAITNSGYILSYKINEPKPEKTYPNLSPDFLERLQKDFISRAKVKKELGYPLKQLHLLCDHKLLYIESDVLPPYFHGLDNAVMKGPDYYPSVISDLEDVNCIPSSQNENDNTRHINLFIYDMNTQQLTPLQLENYPDEKTSLALNADIADDILSNYVTVSKTKDRIALQNMCDIYVYDINANDFIFKKVAPLPYTRNLYVKFCHKNNNYLTLYDDSIYIHYDLKEKKILYKTVVDSLFHKNVIPTALYRITERLDKPKGSLIITNIYTEIKNSLVLSSLDILFKMFVDNKNSVIYALFHNGSILKMDARNLRLLSCYNYCNGRHVSAAFFDEQAQKLCIASGPNHSYLYSSDNIITVIDFKNNEYYSSVQKYPTIERMLLTADRKNIITNSGSSVYLIDAQTLLQKDIIQSREKTYGNQPIDLFEFDGNICISYPQSEACTSYAAGGILACYRIEDNVSFKYAKEVLLPICVLNDETPHLLVKLTKNSNLSYIMSIDNTEEEIVYHFRDTPDGEFGHELILSMTDWNYVYLDDGKTSHSEYLSCRNEDLILHNVSRVGQNCIARKNQITMYEIQGSTGTSFDLIEEPGTEYIAAYSESLHMVYIYNRTNRKIYTCETNGTHRCRTEPLFPHVLTFNCRFESAIGASEYIPEYLQYEIRVQFPNYL